MKDNQIQTFVNSDIGEIRGFIGADGEPWFLAGQVCRALGIKNARDAVASVREKYKTAGIVGVGSADTTIETEAGKRKTLIIPEPFLYELIFQSRKQKAIKFRAWVTSEVLPSLRKHGEYRMEGKLIRKQETDGIKELVKLAESQGSSNAKMYYVQITRMTNSLLGIEAGSRDGLAADKLKQLAVLEGIVDTAVRDGVAMRLHYKDVYKLVKERAGSAIKALGLGGDND